MIAACARGLLIAAIGLAVLPAQACRVLAVFPEHLEPESLSQRNSFYVVQVQRAASDAFDVIVKQSFGGSLQPGVAARMQFAKGEEAHAVCPIDIDVGQSYLVQTHAAKTGLEISRYNWMNVPASHERFAVYVGDLRSAQVAAQARRR